MDVVNYTHARQHLAELMDQVCDDRAPVMITRRKSETVVMMALEEYEGMQETMHLLSSPRNAERLMKSIAQANAGELVEHALLEDE